MYAKGLIVFVLLFAACTKEEITARVYPRVMTREVANLGTGAATFKGEITFTSTKVIDHGFLWTIVGFPTLTNTNCEKQSLGAKDLAGKFEYTVSQGLQVGKTYSMCAYAKSDQYVVYGKTFMFVSK